MTAPRIYGRVYEKCRVEYCDKSAVYVTKQLCRTHNTALRQKGTLDLKQPRTLAGRFDVRVDKGPGCWNWKGAKAKSTGYGLLASRYAHRLSYELHVGPIPAGMEIDHICRNRICVNPEHLRVLDRKGNSENHGGPTKANTSGFRGVYWTKCGWAVFVTHNGQRHWGGRHPTPEAADQTARALRNRLWTYNDRDRISA